MLNCVELKRCEIISDVGKIPYKKSRIQDSIQSSYKVNVVIEDVIGPLLRIYDVLARLFGPRLIGLISLLGPIFHLFVPRQMA